MKDINKNTTKQTKSKKQSVKTAQDYEQELGELTVTLQRVQADFENYKKRTEQERAQLLQAAKMGILTELMPALDNFDRAATHLPKELEANSWAQGMSYVGTQLEQILDGMGISKFEAKAGEHFDEKRHEAIEYVKSNKPDGTIVEQTTPGYEVDGVVVRPAVVKVAQNSKSKEVSE